MLYFRGCTARERLNSISNSIEELLDLINLDFKTLENEECCGSVLLRTGFVDEAKEIMKKNVSKLKDEKIIVSCAGCYKTFKKDYNELLDIELEVIHISQLLRDLIKEGKFDSFLFNSESVHNYTQNESVTYHDPCHLARHMGEYDAPREVINMFSNLNEMEFNKENSRCCGSGGGVKSAFPEIAQSIAIERVIDAENTGCSTIVTSCPFCKLNLDENSSLEVLDLSEFVLKQIKMKSQNENSNNELI